MAPEPRVASVWTPWGRAGRAAGWSWTSWRPLDGTAQGTLSRRGYLGLSPAAQGSGPQPWPGVGGAVSWGSGLARSQGSLQAARAGRPLGPGTRKGGQHSVPPGRSLGRPKAQEEPWDSAAGSSGTLGVPPGGASEGPALPGPAHSCVCSLPRPGPGWPLPSQTDPPLACLPQAPDPCAALRHVPLSGKTDEKPAIPSAPARQGSQ